MPKRDIAARLRQMTAEQCATLDPQEIFTSPEFAEHLQGLVNETMKIGGKATSEIRQCGYYAELSTWLDRRQRHLCQYHQFRIQPLHLAFGTVYHTSWHLLP